MSVASVIRTAQPARGGGTLGEGVPLARMMLGSAPRPLPLALATRASSPPFRLGGLGGAGYWGGDKGGGCAARRGVVEPCEGAVGAEAAGSGPVVVAVPSPVGGPVREPGVVAAAGFHAAVVVLPVPVLAVPVPAGSVVSVGRVLLVVVARGTRSPVNDGTKLRLGQGGRRGGSAGGRSLSEVSTLSALPFSP